MELLAMKQYNVLYEDGLKRLGTQEEIGKPKDISKRNQTEERKIQSSCTILHSHQQSM